MPIRARLILSAAPRCGNKADCVETRLCECHQRYQWAPRLSDCALSGLGKTSVARRYNPNARGHGALFTRARCVVVGFPTGASDIRWWV